MTSRKRATAVAASCTTGWARRRPLPLGVLAGAEARGEQRIAAPPGRIIAVGALALLLTALAGVPALAHSGANLQAPAENLSLGATLFEFSKYGAKHILLGYDHLLFLAALVLLSAAFRDVAAIIGLFAISYSATLIGATLLGIAVPGDLIDAIIALSVGYVGVQLAFGSNPGRINRDPRPPAFVFGLAHGLGLSALLQELQLPGNDVLPSVIGFNIGVELGQIGAMALFLAILLTCRAFPFPARQRLPAGSGFIAVAAVLLAFVVLGLDL